MTQTTAPARLGDEVRRWRELRGLSQLALSARAEVSTRHLSFIENGRSRPTAEMILRLASALEVPMADQNDLLLAGGFAPQHPRRDLADENLSSVMAGLRGLLDAHAPYPALLVDDHWDVVDSNTSVDPLLAGCAPALLEPPINVIRLSLHPDGLAPRIARDSISAECRKRSPTSITWRRLGRPWLARAAWRVGSSAGETSAAATLAPCQRRRAPMRLRCRKPTA